MITPAGDVWYVRMPDGQVLRAGSTAAVRYHLKSGRLPGDCHVRRSSLEAWRVLEDVEQFADLAGDGQARRRREARRSRRTTSGRAGRATLQLQTVGLRGVWTELLTALDSTLMRGKLTVAGCAGLVVGLLLMAASFVPHVAEVASPWVFWAAVALALLMVFGVSSALLSRFTFLELSNLRPATWAEARHRWLGHALRVTLAYVLVMGGAVLLVLLLRWLPGWLLEQHEATWLAAVATALGLVLEVALWPVLGLALPLAPILVVEECSVLRALVQWAKLLREHLPRLFLHETLAGALAALLVVPFLLPVELATVTAPAAEEVAPVAEATLWLLRGLALTPLLGYMAVANVFIYLNLRYEHRPAR